MGHSQVTSPFPNITEHGGYVLIRRWLGDLLTLRRNVGGVKRRVTFSSCPIWSFAPLVWLSEAQGKVEVRIQPEWRPANLYGVQMDYF